MNQTVRRRQRQERASAAHQPRKASRRRSWRWMDWAALLLPVIAMLTIAPFVLGRAAQANAGPAARQEPSRPAADPASAAQIALTARNLGGLRVEIEARITEAGNGEPVRGAVVAAAADMSDMPYAHRLGPLPMRESRDQPGVYTAQAALPMPGQYAFWTESRAPQIKAGRTALFVGAGLP